MRYSVSVVFVPDYVLSKQYSKDLPADIYGNEVFNAGFSDVTPKVKTLTSLSYSVECADFDEVIDKTLAMLEKLYGTAAADFRDFTGMAASDIYEHVPDNIPYRRYISENIFQIVLPGILYCEITKEGINPAEANDSYRSILNMVGWQEFKDLCGEILSVSPQIRNNDLYRSFLFQNFLFSVNDGYGLSTALDMFARFISDLELFRFSQEDPVVEFQLSTKSDNDTMSLSEAYSYLSDSANYNKLICFDISEFLEKSRHNDFKNFLIKLMTFEENYLFAFRVPFLEPSALDTIRKVVADALYVRTVSVRPFNNDELKVCAERLLADSDYKAADDVWEIFFSRLCEEKSDGRFYGIQSVSKVVYEMLWLKAKSDSKMYLSASEGDFNNAHPDKTAQSADAETTTDAESAEISDGQDVPATQDTDSEQTASAGQKTREDSQKDSSRLIRRADIMELSPTFNKETKDGFAALADMIGMEKISDRIREIVAQVKISMENERMDRPCLHMRFVGAPGTGKTTVARILGQIFRENGILRNGYFFEYSARDLCGEYVGQTAPKTSAICRDAYGSVLFIDEAYALYQGDDRKTDYGVEALTTLVSEMENHRDDMVVVMAGYKEDMNKLMEGNAGLRSRMPFLLEFESYSRTQLFDIFMKFVTKHFDCDEAFTEAARAYFNSLSEDYMKSQEFANARFARNLYERCWSKAAMRASLAGERKIILKKEDFMAASGEKEFSEKLFLESRIGF